MMPSNHIFRWGQSESGESLATALRLILLEMLFRRHGHSHWVRAFTGSVVLRIWILLESVGQSRTYISAAVRLGC